jgi:hypothetical protein
MRSSLAGFLPEMEERKRTGRQSVLIYNFGRRIQNERGDKQSLGKMMWWVIF